MKIITIVGIRGAGKTTVLECLVRELRQRGYTVGTAKSVFCPAFHMDKPGSNTDRHAKAGAQVIAARGEHETTFIYPRKLKPSEWLPAFLGCDWVLCEGDYELPVPRIVAAKEETDARERINAITLAVSGCISGTCTELKDRPVLDPRKDIQALTDLLEQKTPDVTELSALDQPLEGEDIVISRSFCAQGCKGHKRKTAAVNVTVNGEQLELTPEQTMQVLTWAGQA